MTYYMSNLCHYESFPLAHILFPPVIFSLHNSKISATDSHSGCFGSSHRRMALSIVLMAAIAWIQAARVPAVRLPVAQSAICYDLTCTELQQDFQCPVVVVWFWSLSHNRSVKRKRTRQTVIDRWSLCYAWIGYHLTVLRRGVDLCLNSTDHRKGLPVRGLVLAGNIVACWMRFQRLAVKPLMRPKVRQQLLTVQL